MGVRRTAAMQIGYIYAQPGSSQSSTSKMEKNCKVIAYIKFRFHLKIYISTISRDRVANTRTSISLNVRK